jgi:hypothetical protein
VARDDAGRVDPAHDRVDVLTRPRFVGDDRAEPVVPEPGSHVLLDTGFDPFLEGPRHLEPVGTDALHAVELGRVMRGGDDHRQLGVMARNEELDRRGW